MGEKQSLQTRVDLYLDTAVFENGYVGLMSQGADEVAADLCIHSQELEDEDMDHVKACVQDYMRWYERSQLTPWNASCPRVIKLGEGDLTTEVD